MRSVEFIKKSLSEEINKKVFLKPFHQEKQYDKYLLVAKPGRLLIHQKITDPSDQFRIEAKLGKQTVGWVNFEQNENHLEALDLWVDPKHRRKGLATAMYKFAKELGNDIMPSSKQTALGKAFWSEKSPVDESQLNQETTLNDLYKGNFPSKDELFWDYVRPGELNKKLSVKTLSKHNLLILLLSQYRVEHIEEILDMLEVEQKRILKKYKNDPNLSNKIILISDNSIIDGNHRALAAAFKGVPIKYVDLAELEEQDIDENNDLPSFRRSLANAVRGKVSQMQADAAIAKAKGEFKWNEGDIVYSPKTGKTYTIAGLRVIKNRPMYYYSCEGNEERGMFYADLAHKNLIKISSGPNEQDISENSNGSLSAEAYKERLLKTLPQIMGLFANTGKGWMPSEEQLLAAVETGYEVMKRTGDVKQAGAAIGHEINSLYKDAQKDVAERLEEAVGGNYLYHATDVNGLMGILQSGAIRAAIGPQAATQAQTKFPTVSVTRDWGYASGSNAKDQISSIGRHAVLILDRDTVENNFKTLSTSQSGIVQGLSLNPYLKKDGLARSQVTDPLARTNAKGKTKFAEPTAKAGGEFEEAVVVPKGVLPIKNTMVGFWINPQSELINNPKIMNDPRRLVMVRPNQFVKPKQQSIQGMAEDATRNNSHARIKYGDLILDYKIDGANVDVRAIIDDKQVGYVIFLRDGKLLIPDDLAVDEEYRGRGIAKKMYDWVKSLPQGFRIIRSGIQTTMGKRFWDKNRGESGNVWEEDVAETFDHPYKVKSKKRDFGEIEMSTKLPDGSNLNIVFAQYVNRNNEKFTEVDFYRDETQEVTGEGDAQRIFATVINAIKRFVKKYKPQILKFSASVFPGAYDNQSRVNLYNRLVQRYAAPLGYDVSIKGQGDVVEYSLSRREDMVEDPVDEAKKRRRKKNQASRSITTGWWSGYYGDNSSGGEDGGGE